MHLQLLLALLGLRKQKRLYEREAVHYIREYTQLYVFALGRVTFEGVLLGLIVFVPLLALAYAFTKVSPALIVTTLGLMALCVPIVTVLMLWQYATERERETRENNRLVVYTINELHSEIVRRIALRENITPHLVCIVDDKEIIGAQSPMPWGDTIFMGRFAYECFDALERIGVVAHELAHGCLPFGRFIPWTTRLLTRTYDRHLEQCLEEWNTLCDAHQVVPEALKKRYAYYYERSSVPILYVLEHSADIVGAMLLGHAVPQWLSLAKCKVIFPNLTGGGWSHPSIDERIKLLLNMDRENILFSSATSRGRNRT